MALQKKQIIMLPTTNKSNLFIGMNNQLRLGNYQFSTHPRIINQCLCIISKEKVKKGEWVYQPVLKAIIKAPFDCDNDDRFLKVIATTDQSLYHFKIGQKLGESEHEDLPQIPQSFVKDFVESNSTITEVMVEYVLTEDHVTPDKSLEGPYSYVLKVSPDNTIIISQTKTYTEQQLLAFACWYSGMEESKVKRQLDKWNETHNN